LRDGALVAHEPASQFTEQRLIALMVGRSIEQLYPPRTAQPTDESVLEVRGLSQPGVAAAVSFSLRRGEVLGVAGLMGSGRTELARMLFGLDPYVSGEVLLEGRPLRGSRVRELIRRGMAFLTESRRDDGLLMETSANGNLGLIALREHAKGMLGVVDRRAIQTAVDSVSRAVALRGNPSLAVRSLSGGNQQKVVFGKWLVRPPKVFLLDEPTRGIDVGAKYEIYRIIDELASKGVGLLLISSEVEELIGVADRILVMRRGEIAAEFARAEFDRERILSAALGAAQ
jgi:ribose transport system ATP-binding protein